MERPCRCINNSSTKPINNNFDSSNNSPSTLLRRPSLSKQCSRKHRRNRRHNLATKPRHSNRHCPCRNNNLQLSRNNHNSSSSLFNTFRTRA